MWNTQTFIAAMLVCAAGLFAGEKPIYLDPSQPVDRRVEDLLSRMTLKEKVGQMNMPCVYLNVLGRDIPSKRESLKRLAEGVFTSEIGPGGGFFTASNEVMRGGPRDQALFYNELQHIAREKTRLGIPLLESEEGTHGVMCSGHTIFPEGPGIGSTWNMPLVRRIYAAAAREARAVGIHQLFTLVIEPNRDPRLGRNEEGFSEDPYLCARIAEAIVRGAQGSDVSAPDKVVTGLCHYPGQSQPVSGFERGAMEISERMLREVFLPPWIAGIRKFGALGVMATYPAIDGIPAHASSGILTKILREELSFQGLVLSEGHGISTLLDEQVAADEKQAGAVALAAGVDVGISWEEAYRGLLIENVQEGRVPVELIDRAARRILRQKFVLGLFDRTYVDPEQAVQAVHTKAHQELALQAAREGIVLLKNQGNLLPLRKDLRTIAVIGPNADHARNQLGDYLSHAIPQHIVTPLEGIRQKLGPRAKVLYARGAEVLGNDRSGFGEAVQAAKSAEIAVVVVGENERLSEKGPTDGEGYDVASLDLTGVQEDLVRAVSETGTPTVVVLVNGRPLSTRWIADNVPALVEAWLPGEQGGAALADILFGDENPSGRLPVTIPRHSGQLPVFYNMKPTKGRWEGGQVKVRPYVDMPGSPLYWFGHGLSYTSFAYGNLRIAPAFSGAGGHVEVRVDVRNTGRRAGQEVVQLYLRDEVSSVTRPLLELKRFEKIPLEPGESKTVRFELTSEDLSFLNARMEPVVEPGTFRVMVGAASDDIRVSGTFEIR
jgi:beta-glucosidase